MGPMSARKARISAEDVATELRQRLPSHIPGTRLPGRAELAQFCGCSEHIIEKAIAMLVDEGLLQRRERGGTFVRAAGGPDPIAGVRVLVQRKQIMLFQQSVMLGISEACQRRRLKMDVTYDPPELTDLEQLRQLADGDPLRIGWVIFTDRLPDEKVMRTWLSVGLPFIIVDDYPTIGRVNLVARDMQQAVFEATDRLLRLGHTRLAAVAVRLPLNRIGEQRLHGYRLAHEKHALTPDPDLIVRTDLPRGSLARVIRPILARSDRPTGIVGMDQLDGCECIGICDLLQVQIPEEISIISAGIHPHLEPPQLPRLSCMDEGHPERMGHLAVDVLIDPQSRRNPTTMWLRAGYVDRGSTAPPPA